MSALTCGGVPAFLFLCVLSGLASWTLFHLPWPFAFDELFSFPTPISFSRLSRHQRSAPNRSSLSHRRGQDRPHPGHSSPRRSRQRPAPHRSRSPKCSSVSREAHSELSRRPQTGWNNMARTYITPGLPLVPCSEELLLTCPPRSVAGVLHPFGRLLPSPSVYTQRPRPWAPGPAARMQVPSRSGTPPLCPLTSLGLQPRSASLRGSLSSNPAKTLDNAVRLIAALLPPEVCPPSPSLKRKGSALVDAHHQTKRFKSLPQPPGFRDLTDAFNAQIQKGKLGDRLFFSDSLWPEDMNFRFRRRWYSGLSQFFRCPNPALDLGGASRRQVCSSEGLVSWPREDGRTRPERLVLRWFPQASYSGSRAVCGGDFRSLQCGPPSRHTKHGYGGETGGIPILG